MAVIEWGVESERIYESGVDKAVLYPYNRWGVAWNGLVSVDGAPTQDSTTPLYYEGMKFDILDDATERTSTVTAFTYPEILDDLTGHPQDYYGYGFGEQEREFFSMCYRSLINTGPDYKIHVLFNQKAKPTNLTRSTNNENVSNVNFSWEMTGVPVLLMGKYTTYMTLDSRKIDPTQMKLLEDTLYGTPTRDPNFVEFIEYVS